MSLEKAPGKKFSDQTDVELAVDADLNNKWKYIDNSKKTPRARVTVGEMDVLDSEPQKRREQPDVSKN